MSGGGIIVANTASILGMVMETQFISESDLGSSSSHFTLRNVSAVAKQHQTNKQTKLFTKELEKLLKSPIFRVIVQVIKFTSLAAD